MRKQQLLGAALAGLIGSTCAVAQDLGKAEFMEYYGKEAAITFWQTNFLPANQGVCVVEFIFGGEALKNPIEGLTFKVRVYDSNGYDLGVGTFRLSEPLGGSRADSHKRAFFEGLLKWPGMEDGEVSPLCHQGVRLVFEAAQGTQAGRTVELVRHDQLHLVPQRLIDVRVK